MICGHGVSSARRRYGAGGVARIPAVTGKGKRKPRKCRICRKRPPWGSKKCPAGVCKRCYHKHVWTERPGARKQDRAGGDKPDRPLIDESWAYEPWAYGPWGDESWIDDEPWPDEPWPDEPWVDESLADEPWVDEQWVDEPIFGQPSVIRVDQPTS